MGISLTALAPSVVALATLLTTPVVPETSFHTFHDLDSEIIEQRIEAKTPHKIQPLKQFVSKPEPKLQAEASRPATGNVAETIVKYANQYNVNSSIMLSIAACESGLRATAANGPYAGIFQFNSSTWISNRKAMGLSTDPVLRNNPEEAAKTAAFKMSRDGFGAWPACSRKALNQIASR